MGLGGLSADGDGVIFGSVCSGMEAASAAWHPLGWEAAFFSEVDPTASRFLAAKYPSVPNYGDMTKFKDWPDHAIDVLVGGTPCQSFSVAGLRKGLDDPRGNLMLTFGAVAKRYKPRFIVWENVPGVLSSDGGRDFGTFLGMLAELGYGFAYRVLDAQFIRVESHSRAVPQRRRRVFVVGHLGDWRPAAAVLFERESLSGNPSPRREAGKSPAPTIAARTKGGGGLGTDFDLDGGLIAKPLRSRHGAAHREDMDTLVPSVAPTLDANMDKKWGSNQWVDNGFAIMSSGQANAEIRTDGGAPSLTCLHEAPIVAHTLRANHDAGEDGSGRGTPLVPVHAFPERLSGTQVAAAENLSPSLGATNPMAVAFAQNQRDELRMMEVAGALSAQAGMKQQTYVQQQWAVRRLTPLECTRLQGFPDDYFDSARLNKPLSDSAKYKLLGNSMAVNVMSWLGRRIDLVEMKYLSDLRAAHAALETK